MAFSKNYKIKDITWHKKGPCILQGHPKEHDLEMECISAMRRWLFPNKEFSDYLRTVDMNKR